jgi:glycosyltransferase involved in cell wall biosynthesis
VCIVTANSLGSVLVSVVIPTYGRPAFLRETLASVWAQSHRPIQVIVVDDSSDSAVAVNAAPEPDLEVLVVRNACNMGPGAARNTGLAHATGELVLFLDDDDLLVPTRLERAVAEIGGACAHVMALEDFWPDGRTRLRDTVYSGDMRRTFTRIAPPQVGQVVWRRDQVLQFDPTLRASEDKEWFIRMRDRSVFAWNPAVGLRYRQHDGERGIDAPTRLRTRMWVSQRHATDLDRSSRSRLRYDVAAAAMQSGRRLLAVENAALSFAGEPSMLRLKLLLRSLVGGSGRPRRGRD